MLQSYFLLQKLFLSVLCKLLVFPETSFILFTFFKFISIIFIESIIFFQLGKIFQTLFLTVNFRSRFYEQILQLFMCCLQTVKLLRCIPDILFQRFFLFLKSFQKLLDFFPFFFCYRLVFQCFLTLKILCVFLFALIYSLI